MDFTPEHALPYPQPSDLVTNASIDIQALADRLDAILPDAGVVTVTVDAANTRESDPVLFHKTFDAPPTVVAIVQGLTAFETVDLGVTAITTTGFTLQYYRATFTGPIDVAWIAAVKL